MMNSKHARKRSSLLGLMTVVIGFTGTFMFYIGLGISGLGLQASSQLKQFLRQELFPTCKVLVPSLLVIGLIICILTIRNTQRPSPPTEIQIFGILLSTAGIVHLMLLWFFAEVCASFL